MPCHWPIKTSVMRSFTRVEPSALMEIVSLKSAIRQLCANRGAPAQSSREQVKKRGSELQRRKQFGNDWFSRRVMNMGMQVRLSG